MPDSRDTLIAHLKSLNLTGDEAAVYVELLRGPSTPSRIGRATDLSRSKVYRLVQQLEKRSLVGRLANGQGVFIVASSPASLEIELADREAQTKQQRSTLEHLVPMLSELQNSSGDSFALRTYEGEAGFKQMCWHELETRDELVCFGGGAIEELIPSHNWAEKYRQLTAEAGFKVRELVNVEVDDRTFAENTAYMENYVCRGIPRAIMPFDSQTSIYNETVAIYHHRHHNKIGIEIISQTYADMMRAMFEHYWQMGIHL